MVAIVSGFIFGLLFISGFAGFLPVVAGGVWDKWLIISVFLGGLLVVAIAGLLLVGGFLSEPLIKLIDLMLMMWVVWVLWVHGFIFSLLFISGFAGLLPVISWVLALKSLIINAIHFSGK